MGVSLNKKQVPLDKYSSETIGKASTPEAAPIGLGTREAFRQKGLLGPEKVGSLMCPTVPNRAEEDNGEGQLPQLHSVCRPRLSPKGAGRK